MSDRHRTVYPLLHAKHESGLWMPSEITLRSYTRDGDTEELSSETTVSFEDIKLSPEFPAFLLGALPRPGTRAREAALEQGVVPAFDTPHAPGAD